MHSEDDATVTAPTSAPDIAPHRQAVIQAYVAQAAVGFAVAALGSIVVLAARDLDVEEARLGWLASAFGAGLIGRRCQRPVAPARRHGTGAAASVPP